MRAHSSGDSYVTVEGTVAGGSEGEGAVVKDPRQSWESGSVATSVASFSTAATGYFDESDEDADKRKWYWFPEGKSHWKRIIYSR